VDRYPFTSPGAPELVLEELVDALTWRGVLNVTFVVGDSGAHEHTQAGAATADVVGAIRVAEALSGRAEESFVEALTDLSLSEYSDGSVEVDWSKIRTHAIVSVGGPGVNYVTYRYNSTIPFVWRYEPGVGSYIYSSLSDTEYHTGYRRYDYAIIALVRDPESSKPVLLVWGLSRYGTQAACYVLQHYDEYRELLQGSAVIIKWRDENGNRMVDENDTIRLRESWSRA